MARRTTSYRFYNGPIVTMDPECPVAGEVITVDHRIAWVGRRGNAPAEYRRAKPVDLKGRLLIPAFSDAHTHILYYAESLKEVNLHGVPTLRMALNRIRKHVADQPRQRGWVTGGGFEVNLWSGGWPSAKDLDRIIPDRPAVFSTHDSHSVWANSEALRRAGIDRDTPDPDSGRIIRDDTGNPTGILLEPAAYHRVTDLVPKPTLRQAEKLITDVQKLVHKKGVVAVGDMGMHDNLTLDVFWSLAKKDKLRLRLWKTVPLDHLDEAIDSGMRSGMGNRWVKIGAVKIFLDGALGSRTAWMLKPYSSDRKNTGMACLSERVLSQSVRRAADAGLASCIHAIGDAAVRSAIKVLARHRTRMPAAQPARIEHLQVIDREDLDLLARSGIVASMQPSHLLTDRDHVDRHWGRRARWTLALRSLWDRGIPLAFGSDAPIEPLDPLEGIGAAVNRAKPRDPRGPWYPSEALTVWEAVWGFTVGAAIAAGDQDTRGMIRPGYLADLTVLDRNLFVIPTQSIPKVEVSMTFVDGLPVYKKET